MILKQKALLAKLVFFLFTVNLLFAEDSIGNNTEITSSPFSVLKEDLYSMNDKNLLVTKQALNLGDVEVFNGAKIRLLEYNTGISTDYEIKKSENWKYNDEGTYIILHDCQKAKEEKFNPVNMALISIINNDKTIFEGWIFSKNSALSLPKIDDHFVYLTECQ